MPELTTLISFMLASIGLTLLPGPDNLFVLSISALNGTKAGIPTALGMAAGNFVHTLAVAIGLSAIIAQSPAAMSVIKIMGIFYLLYLAWQSWHHPLTLDQSEQANIPTNQRALVLFKRGVLMNILNPKVALFFLAFFPQFINQAVGNAAIQTVILGTLFVLQSALIFCFIAVLANRIQPLVLKLSPLTIAGITGGLFLLLSILLAISLYV